LLYSDERGAGVTGSQSNIGETPMITQIAHRVLLAASAAAFAVAGMSQSGRGPGAATLGTAADSAPASGVAEASMLPGDPAVSDATFAPGFPYHEQAFTDFVADSYRQPGVSPAAGDGPDAFYHVMDAAYVRTRPRVGAPPSLASVPVTLDRALDAERARIAAESDPQIQTADEEQSAAWVFHLVKASIPHFSLTRGFEFTNMVARGERQCYSQSVLVAGMLQRMGVPAGVVMVWKSSTGLVSNNGHAVTMARLANGHQLLVDCSDHHTPFTRQEGLFISLNGRYAYVAPVYAPGAAPNAVEVVAYSLESDGEQIGANAARAMDLDFMRSQFDYYRGERVPGGAIAQVKTMPGLEASARYLAASARECPDNPLAVYMLGRVYERLGQLDRARLQFAEAHREYAGFGYVPEGEAEEYARTGAYGAPMSAATIL
jgi:hypothetical protein